MHFINISDLVHSKWRFLEPLSKNPDLHWSFYYGRPGNALERALQRPALGRYRAALRASFAARRDDSSVLVSHLPRAAAATNLARRWICPDRPHIAFAFNFTDLPTGSDRTRLTRWLDGIDTFVVFSRYEQAQYPEYFGFPADRFQYLPWTMQKPQAGPDNPLSQTGPYLCSIGGEGRDYALLAEAMRALPQVKMVIVARPHSIAGLTFSDNVQVYTNLPAPQTWRIAADSQGLVVPLKDAQTACGHITIVGSQLHGLPLIVTRSRGIEDYVQDGKTGFLVEAGDRDALINRLETLWASPGQAKKLGRQAQIQAEAGNDPKIWLEFFETYAATHKAG